MRNVLKVSEPNTSVKDRAYQESLRAKYEVLRREDVEGVLLRNEEKEKGKKSRGL